MGCGLGADRPAARRKPAIAVLDRTDVRSLRALLALLHFEFDFLAFGQAAKARAALDLADARRHLRLTRCAVRLIATRMSRWVGALRETHGVVSTTGASSDDRAAEGLAHLQAAARELIAAARAVLDVAEDLDGVGGVHTGDPAPAITPFASNQARAVSTGSSHAVAPTRGR